MVPEVCRRRGDLYPPPVADAGSKACTRGLRARPRCRSLLEDERRDRCSTTCQPGPFGKLLRLSKCCGKKPAPWPKTPLKDTWRVCAKTADRFPKMSR